MGRGSNHLLWWPIDHYFRTYHLVKLWQAGIPAELQTWENMPYVFQAFSGLPEARETIKGIAEFIRGFSQCKTTITNNR